jgi:hypothetical protein
MRRVNLGLLDNLGGIGPPMPAVVDVAWNGWLCLPFDRRICVQCLEPFTMCSFATRQRLANKRSTNIVISLKAIPC